MNEIRNGAPAPLLERLVDLEPKTQHEARPFRVLDHRDLMASVRRELTWLLGSRHSPPLPPRTRSVIDYGIPDTVSYSGGREEDREALRRHILAAVLAFEPRLGQVRVEVEPAGPGNQTLRVQIRGFLVETAVTEPVSFAFGVETSGATEVAVID